ncbi:MAG: AraC family transcriptional regulator [Eubacterium sp.]|nr:AraC family transcriptional regulator [Eubacterium sp.]
MNALRFEHATLLLKQTNLRIIDICMESGLSDSKQLNKMFLKIYDMTPKEFRQNRMPLSREFNQEASSSQYVFTEPESVRILRVHHHYDCDEPGFINTLPAM